MMTMKDNARKVRPYFVQREHESGEQYYCLCDDTPEAIRDLVIVAHGTDMMPDDFRYEAIAHALDYLSAGGTLDDYDPPCDVYTGALMDYLRSSGDRIGRADEAISEGVASDIASAAMVAQQEEAREVAYRLAEALADMDESEDD